MRGGGARRPILALLLDAGAISVIDGSTARFWRVSTQADLLKGRSERLSIDYDGRLVLGPSTRSVFAPASPFIWCLAQGPDGSVYAGGGNDGLVWHVARDGTSRVVFDAPELEVHALAPAADGALLVATSPDGKVYRVAASGASTVFFDPPDKYIWALALDAQGHPTPVPQLILETDEEKRRNHEAKERLKTRMAEKTKEKQCQNDMICPVY